MGDELSRLAVQLEVTVRCIALAMGVPSKIFNIFSMLYEEAGGEVGSCGKEIRIEEEIRRMIRHLGE